MSAWRELTEDSAAEFRQKTDEYLKAMEAWREWNDEDGFSFADLPPAPPSPVSYDDVGIYLHGYGGGWVFACCPISEIRSAGDVLRWVLHFSEKDWVDSRHLHDFVELALSLLDGKEAAK